MKPLGIERAYDYSPLTNELGMEISVRKERVKFEVSTKNLAFWSFSHGC